MLKEDRRRLILWRNNVTRNKKHFARETLQRAPRACCLFMKASLTLHAERALFEIWEKAE